MLRWATLLTLSLVGGISARVPNDIQALIDAGEWTSARASLEARAEPFDGTQLAESWRWEAERLRRIQIDFAWNSDQMLARIQESWPETTAEDVEQWREEGWLQSFVIDGEVRFFPRDVRHLLLRYPLESQGREPGAAPETVSPEQRSEYHKRVSDYERRAQAVIEAAQESGERLVEPTRIRVTHRIEVEPGEVPAGEMVRCWIPFPRAEDRQTGIELISTDPLEPILAPPEMPQRTVFLTRPAAPSPEPTVFEIVYEFTAWGSYQEVDPDLVTPHSPTSEVFQIYTRQDAPHIVFTPEIVALVDEIVGDETNPYLKAQRIYQWIDDNTVWSGEREYSTLLNAPMLCLERGRGDCGVRALTFITMCRAAGVPARWESGWRALPERTGMHDWARFHVEPYGWLWADVDDGVHPTWQGEKAQWFHFGNIEPHRIVVNSDISRPFYPQKEHFRSETVDSQRGEVEWDGGNLYFDQWDYDVSAEVID